MFVSVLELTFFQIWERIIIESFCFSLYLVQILYLVGVLLMTSDLLTCGHSQQCSGFLPVVSAATLYVLSEANSVVDLGF